MGRYQLQVIMTTLLAGDIGGTKTILRLVEADGLNKSGTKLRSLHETLYASHDFPDLVPMVRQFLDAAALQGPFPQPSRACFAIAGPVVENTSTLTNLSWSLSAFRLQKELALDEVKLINDFEAIGYGVLALDSSDLMTLQSGITKVGAPIAVIGAGTGLGQGFLIQQNGDYGVFPSEGGHTDFAPRNDLEFDLLKYLIEKHNIARVSVERVVSGQGIVSIYEFLRDRQVATESPEMAAVFTAWQQEIGMREKTVTVNPAVAISKAALKQQDPLCEETMKLFMGAYGAEAGNLALKLLPYGGLYIAGGIAAKNLPLFQSGEFMATFHSKGRMSRLLEQIPTHIVLNPKVGLIGAALCADRL